jgi:hypothetical protein
MDEFRILLTNGSERSLSTSAGRTLAHSLTTKPDAFWDDPVSVTHEPGGEWLNLLHVPELGCVISCCGRGDSVEHFLADPQSSDTRPQPVRKLGADQAYPRRLFVSATSAASALVAFVETVERDPGGCWLRVDEAMRGSV